MAFPSTTVATSPAARPLRRPPVHAAQRMLLALLAGLCIAATLPPLGWWPLGPVGFAVLALTLEGQSWKRRLLEGWIFGIGLFSIGLAWMAEFTGAGALIAVPIEASFFAVATLLTPSGRWGWLALPGLLTLAEAARERWPFGGLPLGGPALGQAGGPLAQVASLSGALGVLTLTAVLGIAIAGAVRGASRGAVAAAAAVALVALAAAALLSHGTATGRVLQVASVQGGGPRGIPAVETRPIYAFERQLAANAAIRPPVQLVLWPEDVIQTTKPLDRSRQVAQMSAIARRLHATVVAGVVTLTGTAFHNLAVAWNPNGQIAGSYDKVHRVPFGEYVPDRAFFSHFANLSLVPRNAIPGKGPGILHTTAGPLGVTISYEVFFSRRARAAMQAGAQVLLVPTNASSYTTPQVPSQEVAAAQLRAIETGRWVVQSAPTGYSAFVNPHGAVLQRSHLGQPGVLQGTVALRTGQTPYVALGSLPLLVLAGLLGAAAWELQWRHSHRNPVAQGVQQAI